jgi:signal transduction histidine kinase
MQNYSGKTIFFLTLLIAFFSNSSILAITPQPEKGVLDLRNQTIDENYLISLNGEWEFYWMRMLGPQHFNRSSKPQPDNFIRVPSYWTENARNGEKLAPHGYATYRLTILLPQNTMDALGLDIKVMDSSYDLYVNGKYLGGNGLPGTSENNSVPAYEPKIYRFIPGSDKLEIIINISNYHHRRGGFWLPIEMGTFSRIQTRAATRLTRSVATTSIILAFSLMFIFFFLIYPRDKVSLFFAIALAGVGLRPLFNYEFLISFFTDPGWTWIVRMEYMATNMAVVGGFLLINAIYPSKINRILSASALLITAPLIGIIVLSEVTFFAHTVHISYLMIAVFSVSAITNSFIRLLRKKRKEDLLYLIAFLILFYGAAHDILMASINISGGGKYIAPDALLIFIVIQAALLIHKWVKSFTEKEKLRIEIEELNRALEDKVKQRTAQLSKAKTEAEKHSLRIEEQNRKLSETVALKNKVFSVIAHDLRSPVVNILYILNLLKEEEYQDKQESLTNASIEYSQSVINLLENMLVWGRGQEERIKYTPGQHDLAEIILTNMSIYRENSDRKDLKVSFTQRGKTTAWIDKDLIDIIIRNLLSNAIKYSKRGGRISILLKESEKETGWVILKVCDRGVGIEPEIIKRILNNEEIYSTPGTDNEKGTGLGLKLSNELVAINRGLLEVESAPGEGTCFIITLPANQEKVKESLR